jgi:hypothetical protein
MRFVRGLHFWAAQAMYVTAILHLLRIFFTGSYKRPREGNWLIGGGDVRARDLRAVHRHRAEVGPGRIRGPRPQHRDRQPPRRRRPLAPPTSPAGSVSTSLDGPAGTVTALRVAISGLVLIVAIVLAARVMIALERFRRRSLEAGSNEE